MSLQSLHHPGHTLTQDALLGWSTYLKEGGQARAIRTCEIERAVRVKLSARCTSAAVKNLVTWTTTPVGRPQTFKLTPQIACCVSEMLAHTAKVSLQLHGSPKA